MAITKTFDILNLNGVKGYIRDSWSRRKIVALQTTVAAQAQTIATLQSKYTALEARVSALEGGNT